MKAILKPSCKTCPTPLHRTKAALLPALEGIHTNGFFGLLAIPRQIPLLPVKPAVSLLIAIKVIEVNIMPIPVPKPRHIIEKSENVVRVILPSKKNVVHILWTSLWLFMWGYMVFSLLYIAVMFSKAIQLGKNSTHPVQSGGVFTMVSVFFLLFFIVLLAMGVFGIYRFLWLLAGKEIIEADSNLLKISRQTPVGKSVKEYLASEVKDLRVAVEQASYSPFTRWRRLLNQNGMIAFDYGAQTFRFGAEIDEAVAKQMILALKEGLPQQKAG